MVIPAQESTTSLDEFQRQMQTSLDEAKRTVKEITVMLEQSQIEMSRLTQRSTSVNAQVQLVQSQLETLPRAEIRQVYVAAMETQQRLLVMRGQLERLQSEQSYLQRQILLLEEILAYVKENRDTLSGRKAKANGVAMLEMAINAQEAERLRLSRQMHDGPAQALSNFIVQAEIATRYFDMDPSKAKEELTALKTAAMTTFQKVRVFIFELRPMMLDDLGLLPTIRRYVDSFREQTGLDVSLVVQGDERRLEPYLEVMIFRSIQEIMGNAARFNVDNPVKISINVQVVMEDNTARVSVTDNGKGFDASTLNEKSGLGLKLIRERVDMLGGTMDIDAAVNQGCKVVFQIPFSAVV